METRRSARNWPYYYARTRNAFDADDCVAAENWDLVLFERRHGVSLNKFQVEAWRRAARWYIYAEWRECNYCARSRGRETWGQEIPRWGRLRTHVEDHVFERLVAYHSAERRILARIEVLRFLERLPSKTLRVHAALMLLNYTEREIAGIRHHPLTEMKARTVELLALAAEYARTGLAKEDRPPLAIGAAPGRASSDRVRAWRSEFRRALWERYRLTVGQWYRLTRSERDRLRAGRCAPPSPPQGRGAGLISRQAGAAG